VGADSNPQPSVGFAGVSQSIPWECRPRFRLRDERNQWSFFFIYFEIKKKGEKIPNNRVSQVLFKHELLIQSIVACKQILDLLF